MSVAEIRPSAPAPDASVQEEQILRLYIAGQTPKSIKAFANLKKICEEHMPGRYRIEVIDLIQNPQLAAGDQILAVPTLVRRLPEPVRRIIGDLSHTDRVLVGLDSSGKSDELTALGRLVAMHVAASNPQAVDPAGLDPAVVEREKNVLADKFRQQGKPENVIAKIVESGLKTFYKEVCLLEQPYVHDDKKTVAQALKEAEGKVGGPIKVTGFVRFAVGEGVEKSDAE